MKYYVTGLVKCVAGIDVEADSIEEAVAIAKKNCLCGDPLDPPEFDVESVVRDFSEPADQVSEDATESEDGPSDKEEKACTGNKNKKCGGCRMHKNKKSIYVDPYMGLSPLIEWLDSLEEGVH